MLSRAASNALLKTLEEPPGHTVFVLATTEPYKLPDTIRSRTKSPEYYQGLEIVSAALGDDAGLLGAVALAQSELDQSRIAGN